jgi:hypothetical protein
LRIQIAPTRSTVLAVMSTYLARGGESMSRKVMLAAVCAVAFAATSGAAFAAQAPGQLGYEGQPGNQGGGTSQGLLGYEGQPGNQGG